MADATVTSIPVKTWVLVATATTVCTLTVKDYNYRYYQTKRDTGGTAPTAISGDVIPAEAVELFLDCNQDLLVSATDMDVYVCSFSKDNMLASVGAGSVRVDA